ncbi:MAG: acetyl-CoA carboxylase biotin carboxyl carrier protein [Synechococcales bacterium]|nr:acetyl-CoA carboxylase biotin carboxyl carrier protein [Synechococcales bacterium]
MELNFNDLRELLSVFNQTDIEELTIKSGDFELTVRKGRQGEMIVGAGGVSAAPAASPPPVEMPTAPATPPSSAAPSAHSPSAPSPNLVDSRLTDVTSPMVGTFYRAPAPDEPSFVEIGDRINPGQTVCIIEAMKLMNELEAEISGEVVEILVENGEPVEFGQVLMRVKTV